MAIIVRRRTSQNGVFGLKMHWDQFARAMEMQLGSFLQDARFLYLTRNDVLGQAISLVIAVQSGQWVTGHKRIRAPCYSSEQIRMAIETILGQRTQWERFFASRGIEPLRLIYEDFEAERLRHLSSVFEFLEIAQPEVPVELDPIGVQRTDVNQQWRRRFLEEVSGDDSASQPRRVGIA